MFKDFLNLVYPNVCAGCGDVIANDDAPICIECKINLPRTYYYSIPQNRVARLFWGKVPLERVFASFFYIDNGVLKQMIHELKYRGNKKVGLELAKQIAKEITEIKLDIDVIIPVPLHPKKEKIRGYNQSFIIAQGIQNELGVAIDTTTLVRKVHTQSQTKKAKYERWENVGEIFELTNNEKLRDKHILIVDDVITTGSTIEACCKVLTVIKGVRISVAALACPQM